MMVKPFASPASSCASLASDASDESSFYPFSSDAGLFEELHKLQTLGVALQGRQGQCCYELLYGGEVDRAGNCLFDAVAVALGGGAGSLLTGTQVREQCVERFRCLASAGQLPHSVQQRIANLYSPDLRSGWGVEPTQERKLLVPVADLGEADGAIALAMAAGLNWAAAAEGVYQDLGWAVDTPETWAAYMRLAGGRCDEHRVVTLQHTEEGLYAVSVSGPGQGAFGDDLAIEVLATEFERDIYVVQAHGAGSCFEQALFFLPHAPLTEAARRRAGDPLFLLMKGRDWCSAGGDHYEPLLAQKRAQADGPPPYIVL